MVDRTKYDSEELTPKIGLRQIFGRLSLKSELCKSAAKAGLLSVEIFAMLGDSAKAAKDQLRVLIPDGELGADQPEILILHAARSSLVGMLSSPNTVRQSQSSHGRRSVEDPGDGSGGPCRVQSKVREAASRRSSTRRS